MSPMNPRLLRPRASSGWSPLRLPSLGFWYDPSQSSSVTLNAGNVSQLNDLSGNGRHATQGTAANQPPWLSTGVNGKPCLDFGTTQNSRNLSWAPSAETSDWRELFIVCRYDRGTTFLAFEGLVSGNTNNSLNIGLSAGSLSTTAFFTTNSPSTSHIWDKLGINGGAYSDVVPAGAGAGWPVLPAINSLSVLHVFADAQSLCNGIRIGADRPLASRGWLGLIGESFAASTGLTATERTTAISYLKKKWGVP